MHRVRASVPPDAIRIGDEVWQEAFRETIRLRNRARLRSLDGDHAASLPVPAPTALAEPPGSASTVDEAPVRRTVTITGRGAERNLPWPSEGARTRSARRPHERAGFKPDRVALWAVFLGVLLVLVAAASAHV